MYFSKINLYFAVLVLTFSACQKAEDFEDLDLLLNKNWKLIKITQGSADITKACDIDDVLTFTDTKNYTFSFGENFCDETTEQNTSSKGWEFKNNFTQLILSSKLKTDSGVFNLYPRWDIVELTENTLILRDAGAEDNDIVPIVQEYRL